MRSNPEVDPAGRVLSTLVKRAVRGSRQPPSTFVPQIGAGLLLVVAALYCFAVPIPPWGWTLVILAAAGGFSFALFLHTYLKRRAYYRIEQAHQLCRLMDIPAAGAHLDRCLSSAACPEPVRAMGLVELGHMCLAANQARLGETAFEAAMKRREFLAGPWLCRAEVGLAEAKLRGQQLTDANQTISRLLARCLPQPYRSRVSLLTCLQRLHMGHARELVEKSETLWQEFREHLGVEAAYGYGLLAVALDRCGQAAKALKYWSDATLLIRPERLVQRYPELNTLALKYGASEWPW